MAFKRGAIYRANFNPSKGTEAGKIRPCLVIQTDLLSQAGHLSTTVIPLTTQLLEDAEPLRFRIKAREKLLKDSDVMMDQTRTLDNGRLDAGRILTQLTAQELIRVEHYLHIVLGLERQL